MMRRIVKRTLHLLPLRTRQIKSNVYGVKGKNCGDLGINNPAIRARSVANMVNATLDFWKSEPSMLDIGAGDGREAMTMLKAGLVRKVRLIELPDETIKLNCEKSIKTNMKELTEEQKKMVEVVWANVCDPAITFDGFEWVYCSAPVNPDFWSVVLLKTLLSKQTEMLTAPIAYLDTIGVKAKRLGSFFETKLAGGGGTKRQHVSIPLTADTREALKNTWWVWLKGQTESEPSTENLQNALAEVTEDCLRG